MLPSHPSWTRLFMKYLKSTPSTQGLCYLYNEGHKGQDSSCLEEANIWEGWQVQRAATGKWLPSTDGMFQSPLNPEVAMCYSPLKGEESSVTHITIRSVFLRSWSAPCMLSTSICWKLKDLGSRRWRSPTELKEHGSHAPVHRAFPGGPVVMGASLGAQWRRIYLPMQETQEMQVRSLGQEDPLEGQMETLSGILAWRLQRTEKPGRLRPTGSQKSDTPEATEHPHTHQWLWLRAFIVASWVLSLTGEPRSHKPSVKKRKIGP